MPSPGPPLLYSFRRCPYAIRARLALQVTQSECELREVVLRDKPPRMLSASPKGTVPVLVLEQRSALEGKVLEGKALEGNAPAGKVLEESLDIMLWCLRERDPGEWLGGDEEYVPEAIALIGRNDGEFKYNLDRYKYADRHPSPDSDSPEDSLDHRELAAKFLRELDARLSKSPWLLGSRLSLADAALAPFVRQFANTDRSWFDAQPWPSLCAWLEDFLVSPLFLSVMGKYPQWHEGDQAKLFPESRSTGWQRS